MKSLLNYVKVFSFPLLLFTVFALSTEGFGWHSLPIVFSQITIPAVLGLSMVMILNVGLMDLSLGARTLFAASVGAMFANKFGIAGLLFGCFFGGIAGSFVMGLLYYFLKIPALVVSLGIMMIYEVLGARITGVTGFMQISPEQYAIASYPNNVIIMIIAAIICYFIIYKTKTGLNITAVGDDELLCRNVGINPDIIKLNAFVLSGVFCGFGSLLLISYSGSVSTAISMSTMSIVFKPLMCVLIGYQMVKIINNIPLLIIISSVCLTIIFNGFIALGFSDAIQNIFLGAFLILVIGFSSHSLALSEWLKKKSLKKIYRDIEPKTEQYN